MLRRRTLLTSGAAAALAPLLNRPAMAAVSVPTPLKPGARIRGVNPGTWMEPDRDLDREPTARHLAGEPTAAEAKTEGVDDADRVAPEHEAPDAAPLHGELADLGARLEGQIKASKALSAAQRALERIHREGRFTWRTPRSSCAGR